MKLSIIIPIYNAEKYIKECLHSILEELEPEMELLLLDDGSNDGSYKIIKEYKQNNIRIFHHDNRGVSYTRNRGIKEARGEYIMFVDSDDCLCLGWSKIVKEALCDNNEVFYFLNGAVKYKVKKIDIIENIFGVRTKCKLGNVSAPWSKIYKRVFLIQNNLKFDENLINGEDAIFNLQVIIQSKKFACINKSFYCYRIYLESSTRKYNDKFFDSNLYFLKKAEKILAGEGVATYQSNRYICKSVVYSTYLYLVLINTLRKEDDRIEALNRFKENKLQEYFNEFYWSKDCSILVNIVYILVKNQRINLALRTIELRKVLRNIKCQKKYEETTNGKKDWNNYVS